MAPRSPLNAGPIRRSLLLDFARLVGVIGGALLWCAAMAASPRTPVTTAHAIGAISLERNCFGCADGSLITLLRNGTALLTVPGNARLGTRERVSKGTLAQADFAALAQLVVAKGVLEMQDSYEDPELMDGAWTTLTLSSGDGDSTRAPLKRVFSRESAGPEGLKAVETAIEALRARITFLPERP